MTSQSPIIVSDVSDDEENIYRGIYDATPTSDSESSESSTSPDMPTRYRFSPFDTEEEGRPSKKQKVSDLNLKCVVCFDGEEEGSGFKCQACNVWVHFEPCYKSFLNSSNQILCSSCQKVIPRSQWYVLNFPIELMVEMKQIWQKNQLNQEEKAEPALFHRAQGRILAAPFRAALSCIVCKKQFCRDCQCPAHVGMACNEDARANVETILKDTKPCPNKKCQERIIRIEGCFQMWCVKCNTFFDWSSLKILDNPTLKHNPHYLEWKKRQETDRTTIVDDDGMPHFDTVQLAHNEKLALWHKWNEASGIRRLIESATEGVDKVRQHLRACQTKRQDAGVQYTMCKLNPKTTRKELEDATAVHQKEVFKYAEQEEKFLILYDVYFFLKSSLILLLTKYLENANVDLLYKACVNLESETNQRLEQLHFYPPMGLGRLFVFI